MSNITIPVIKDPYDNGYDLLPYPTLKLTTGTTVLVGCNGTGKSTVLRLIADQCKENDIPCKCFVLRDLSSDRHYDREMYMGNYEYVVLSRWSSEGEKIMRNMARLAGKIGAFVSKCKDNGRNDFVLLFDEIDSGLSIDNIQEIKTELFDVIKEDTPECYIVASANSYELARCERCIDVQTGEGKFFGFYEDYRRFIMESRKLKDERIDV